MHIIACEQMTSIWDDIHGIKPTDVEEGKTIIFIRQGTA